MRRERDLITEKYIKKNIFLEIQEMIVKTLKKTQTIFIINQTILIIITKLIIILNRNIKSHAKIIRVIITELNIKQSSLLLS